MRSVLPLTLQLLTFFFCEDYIRSMQLSPLTYHCLRKEAARPAPRGGDAAKHEGGLRLKVAEKMLKMETLMWRYTDSVQDVGT